MLLSYSHLLFHKICEANCLPFTSIFEFSGKDITSLLLLHYLTTEFVLVSDFSEGTCPHAAERPAS